MRCLYCRRRIGAIRRMVDQEFCSSDHRRRFRTSSARALRDAGELLADYDDYLAVADSPEKKNRSAGGTRFGMGIAAMVGLTIGLSLWIVPSSPLPIPATELRYSLSSSSIGQRLSSIFPDSPKINLRQDFRMGLGEWVGAGTSSDHQPGVLRADTLRIWKPTLRLADYQMEFQAQIEKKAVGWAFRASDVRNYYGTKILIPESTGGRAEIEHFIVLRGHEYERVRLPIPVSIRPETLYRVRVRIKGDQFSTSVDGQVIDTWRDRRLARGGVGFFSDKGEMASVRWVSLSEAENFFSRLFAAGLFLPPSSVLGGAPTAF